MKKVTVSSGEFFCVSCQRITRYALNDVVEKGRIWLIPVQGDVIESFVECQVCQQVYETDYLRAAPTNDIQIVTAIKEMLLSGASVQEVKVHLGKSGVSDAKINSYTSVASGIGRRRCVQCDSIYHASVTQCRKCGVPLPAKSFSRESS